VIILLCPFIIRQQNLVKLFADHIPSFGMDRKPEAVVGCSAVQFDFNSPHFTIPNAYSTIINRCAG